MICKGKYTFKIKIWNDYKRTFLFFIWKTHLVLKKRNIKRLHSWTYLFSKLARSCGLMQCEELIKEEMNCWRREDIKGGDAMPSAVEDCQVPSKIAKEVDDERQKRQWQEIAAAAEIRRVGRPGRSTDVHNMHRGWSGRPARSTAMPDWQTPSLGFYGSTDPVDRKTLTDKPQLSGFLGRPSRSTGIRKSVDRPGRPTVGFWVKSADPLYEVFKPMFILGFKLSAKKY